MDAALIVFLSIMAFLIMLMVRNCMVFSAREKWREKIHKENLRRLRNDDYTSLRDGCGYDLMPDYNRMVLTFWVWDFDKFITPEFRERLGRT